MRYEEALAALCRSRPQAQPNAGFKRQLLEFQKIVFGDDDDDDLRISTSMGRRSSSLSETSSPRSVMVPRRSSSASSFTANHFKGEGGGTHD